MFSLHLDKKCVRAFYVTSLFTPAFLVMRYCAVFSNIIHCLTKYCVNNIIAL